MSEKINNIIIDIPEPFCDKEVFINGVKFIRCGYRSSRKGDVVYSFPKNSLVVRETDSMTPFWIYIPVFENLISTKINLDGLELDGSETEVEEHKEEQAKIEQEKIKIQQRIRLRKFEKRERERILGKKLENSDEDIEQNPKQGIIEKDVINWKNRWEKRSRKKEKQNENVSEIHPKIPLVWEKYQENPFAYKQLDKKYEENLYKKYDKKYDKKLQENSYKKFIDDYVDKREHDKSYYTRDTDNFHDTYT